MTTKPPSVSPLAVYLRGLMAACEPGSASGRKLASWLHGNAALAGIDFREATGSRGAAFRPLKRAAWDKLAGAIAQAATLAPSRDALSGNLAVFGQALGLDRIDLDILRFVLLTRFEWRLRDLGSDLVATRALDSAELIARAIDGPPAEIRDRLLHGALATLNLVQQESEAAGRFAFYVPYQIRRALLPPSEGLADIERHLIGTPMRPRLDAEAFSHVAAERDFLIRLLREAVEQQETGINILLYGPPGTGKSEFCKMIAAAIGCDLFAVGEADEDGDELERDGRLDALRIAERLARRRGRALLLFDEMEDVLQGGARSGAAQAIRRAGSKIFFNRLLERNAVPVLWTSNAIDEFDPAFLRRMSFALELKQPPVAARTQLWRELAQRSGLALADQDAALLAQRYDVAPSLMSSATQAVMLAAGNAGELDLVMRALSGPLGIRAALPPAGAGHFVPELVNADTDLGALEAALTRPGAARDYAMCLYGPPGTGKSAFARHLAQASGLAPLVKRGSDLLSKWLGETERRIADAFAEARNGPCFLIIDEAEGFLWSRDGASRSWEVSMVNELLVAMETHPLPLACTTNHVDRLDPAALRRFSFKIKLDALTEPQAALAYRRFFDRAPPVSLRRLDGVTPGDFAVVAKRLRFLGDAAASDAAILDLLEQEVAVKRRGGRRIGF